MKNRDSINKILLMGLHLGLGAVSGSSPYISAIWFYGFFLYSVFRVLSTKNEGDFANLAVCYLISLEIVIRMGKSQIVFYESGKYACAALMLMGMMVEQKRRNIPKFALVYFALLIPSVFVANYADFGDLMDRISFNLSGPLSLATACLYFYKRKITRKGFEQMIFYVILPLISACALVRSKIPSAENLVFHTDSSKALSGGFGPNQVSAVLGFGFAVLFVAWLVRAKVTLNHFTDILIGIVFLAFGLLTFSRGGVVSAIFALLGAMVTLVASGQNIKAVKQIVNLLLVIVVLGSSAWVAVDSFTNGFLSLRYEKALNVDENSKEQYINTTGRSEIANEDLKIFKDYPIFGIGPGQAAAIRGRDLGTAWVAHTEFSRLLAEHGVFGIICIIIILLSPLPVFRGQTPEGKTIMAAFILISASDMLHVGMRLAFIGISYGIGFANFDFKSINPLKRTAYS